MRSGFGNWQGEGGSELVWHLGNLSIDCQTSFRLSVPFGIGMLTVMAGRMVRSEKEVSGEGTRAPLTTRKVPCG